MQSGLRGPVDERHRAVSIFPHVKLEPVASGWSDAERQCGRAAENGRRGIDDRDIAQDRGVELDVLERLAGTGEGDFGLGGSLGVVERGFGGAALRDGAQVMDGEHLLESTLLRVELRGGEVHERRQIAHPREVAFESRAQVLFSTTMKTISTGAGRNTEGEEPARDERVDFGCSA